ncbi:flavodoxin domain-containing protein [Hyphomicrobium sp. D-2]|uniref:diflavin oxidoreductase n=1 Tax=Hyphomicrobium sp. D-2 TaxID=3041621 RepID=UPI0024539ADD|nr:flavodoxin domain-containing protein [Hyphomicrobium sp. D-2]MDH4981114.1 flavodoxin domain-containing protein [Hyphomicrobium sp. D-2]
MTAQPLLPKNAPFTQEEIEVLNSVVARTTPQQRAWLAGFFAGFEAAQGGGAIAAVPAQKPRQPLTVLYASESGNAEALALRSKKIAQKHGLDARIVDFADADFDLLKKAKNILVYAATWGEGDPPSRAVDFYNALMSDEAPRIDGVRFAVLALGDSAYVEFCATGRLIDERLAALGGVRAFDRIDLDLDYAKQAAEWTEKALGELAPADAGNATVVHVDFKSPLLAEDDDEPRYTVESPLTGEITALVDLNGTGSSRETWHVEIAADAPGFSYLPGDAIGVVPENDPQLALEVAEAVGLGADGEVVKKLRERYDVTTLSRPLIEAFSKLTQRTDAAKLLEPEAFAAFAADRQLVDLFETYSEKLTPEQLFSLLRPLPGRLYSVASSPKAHPGEAHLLVGAVRWASHGRERRGVCSTYFADRRRTGDEVRVYVKPNRHFRIPEDGNRPIIMIGAGTGVAPYRGFIEERAELEHKGKSWLFFGERNFTNDFLYQLEWQEHLASETLSRIDVAFSRDQPEKIYVQHRLWDRREELLDWIADGAHVYVCGDEKGMARDVDDTLARILAETARGDDEVGRAKLKELAKAGRYQRDVY